MRLSLIFNSETEASMVLVFSEQKYPRLEYIISLMFREILNTEVQITTDVEAFLNSPHLKIAYSSQPPEAGFFIPTHPLLTSSTLEMPPLQPVTWHGETGFFPTSSGSFMPFDPFASAFLAVSRLEEYSKENRDKHGRFNAAGSFLFRHDMLQKAVVNRWAFLMARTLEKLSGKSLFPDPQSHILTTIDIDNSWAYRHKGLIRSCSTLLKRVVTGNINQATEQIAVLLGRRSDPYETYPFLFSFFHGREESVRFFLLLGDYGRYDRQVSWKNPSFQKLIREISSRFSVGIHPSYEAGRSRKADLTLREKKRLEKITRMQITSARQHYLLLEFPQTYRKLLEAGITCDFTMGYPDQPGFRAGTATPFYFYDLEKEETTPLKIYPFQVMDVTLSQYLGLSPHQASSIVKALRKEVRNWGGVFTTIWHNESLDGEGKWAGYREVFEQIHREESGNE